jgi:hypothetical protein
MYFLESGALDRSAILTASELAKFLCITDVGFKLSYLIQEFLALGCLYQDVMRCPALTKSAYRLLCIVCIPAPFMLFPFLTATIMLSPHK